MKKIPVPMLKKKEDRYSQQRIRQFSKNVKKMYEQFRAAENRPGVARIDLENKAIQFRLYGLAIFRGQ